MGLTSAVRRNDFLHNDLKIQIEIDVSACANNGTSDAVI